MSSRIKSIVAVALALPLALAAATPAPDKLASSPEHLASSPEHVERRIVLFRSTTSKPVSVSARDQEELEANLDGQRILYSRWIQVNDIDPLTAVPGDRVLIDVSSGESFELLITKVEEAPSGVSIFWYGRFPDQTHSSFFVGFIRAQGSGERATFEGASLNIPGQRRAFSIQSSPKLPGWALVREVIPDSGADLPNDAVDANRVEKERSQTSDPQNR